MSAIAEVRRARRARRLDLEMEEDKARLLKLEIEMAQLQVDQARRFRGLSAAVVLGFLTLLSTLAFHRWDRIANEQNMLLQHDLGLARAAWERAASESEAREIIREMIKEKLISHPYVVAQFRSGSFPGVSPEQRRLRDFSKPWGANPGFGPVIASGEMEVSKAILQQVDGTAVAFEYSVKRTVGEEGTLGAGRELCDEIFLADRGVKIVVLHWDDARRFPAYKFVIRNLEDEGPSWEFIEIATPSAYVEEDSDSLADSDDRSALMPTEGPSIGIPARLALAMLM